MTKKHNVEGFNWGKKPNKIDFDFAKLSINQALDLFLNTMKTPYLTNQNNSQSSILNQLNVKVSN
jgi:hypothetical protein